jgi:hypothetical protein
MRLTFRSCGLAILATFATGCSFLNGDIEIGHRGASIVGRLVSPDKAHILLDIELDRGAMGATSIVSALVAYGDTMIIPRDRLLPCTDLPLFPCYFPSRWLSSDTLEVYLNDLGAARIGIELEAHVMAFHDVWLKVVPHRYSKNEQATIEHYAFSPAGDRILIAYRYRGVSELQLSVIGIHDALPRYGNVLVLPESSFNPITSVRWKSVNEIAIGLRSAYSSGIRSQLCTNLPVEVSFEEHGRSNGLYNSPLFPIDHEVLVREFTLRTKGRITETQWSMDNDRSVFRYDYAFSWGTDTVRSYFRIFQPHGEETYDPGDSLEIWLDPRNHILHVPVGPGAQGLLQRL